MFRLDYFSDELIIQALLKSYPQTICAYHPGASCAS